MKFTAKITGLGAYLPANILKNAQFEKTLDTTDEWIVSRTGMKERRIADPDETNSDMGAKAAKKALQAAKIAPEDIDLILVGTLSPDYPFPSTACLIQDQLQATSAAAVDVQAACSGFIYTLSMAQAYVNSGIYKKVLVVCSEKLSPIVDYQDRSTCILFGDGAAACVVESDHKPGLVIDHINLGSDGGKFDLVMLPAGGTKLPACEQTVRNRNHYICMEGREVYKNAVRRMEEAIKKCLDVTKTKKEQISWLVPHQANLRIIESLAKRFEVANERVFITVHKYGNTSSSSVGIALKELMETKQVQGGEKIVLTAFGAGLTFGAAQLTYDESQTTEKEEINL